MKKVLAFSLLFLCILNVNAQRGRGTYKAQNMIFGPQLGIGLAYGSQPGISAPLKKNIPGTGMDFGMSFYYFKTASLSFGASAMYSIGRWKIETADNEIALQPDMQYMVTERHISVPLEMNWFFTPYSERYFLGLGIEPGYLIQKDLERKRSNGTDTAFAYRYPLAPSGYSRFSAGFTAKIGMDSDIGFGNVMRFYLQWTTRGVFRKEGGLSSSGMVLVGVQYFFSE